MMEGSMQEATLAEPEQTVCEFEGTRRPVFAEELPPADEEMLEKELSELDTLGLGLKEGGDAAGLLEAACLPSGDEMTLREGYMPTSPVYSSIDLPEEDEVRAPNKKRPHAVASGDAVPEPEEQRSTSRGQRRIKLSLQPQPPTCDTLLSPMPVDEPAAAGTEQSCPTFPGQPPEVNDRPRATSFGASQLAPAFHTKEMPAERWWQEGTR
ncbi:hypothetical protein KFL_011960025 [Klebsormidium nitens]|uniref:Uncharacterized protein n=1 Tax=Klebsormidium nitens TaxID=105231 RepID=A0A1Y1IPW9_KLENI|nr:hypothetical protein KFL_011960025 [Klebsormidium nitens]|eukprot:GAQ92910.1 hypothetical protein KFL_011960025 [Klebsormidium nitens]